MTVEQPEISKSADESSEMRRLRRRLALLIALVAIAVYLPTLDMAFTWDDAKLIVHNDRIDDPGYVRELFFEGNLWRPMKRLTFVLDHALWGMNPSGFHLTNILLHSAVSLTLYLFLLRLGTGAVASAVAALSFAVHPIHVEAVANISHRKESLSLLFYLLAFIAYLYARTTKGSSLSTVLTRVAAMGASAGCYLVAMLSKEVGAVMFPALVLVYELVLAKRDGAARRDDAWWLVGGVAMAPVLALFYVRGYLSGLIARFGGPQILLITGHQIDSYAALIPTLLKAFALGLGLLVWPWPLYLDRSFPLPGGLLEWPPLAGLLLLLAMLAVIAATRRRAPLLCFAACWYLLNLLPVSNVVPLTHWMFAERFLYVPSVGFALAMGLAVDHLQSTRSRQMAQYGILGGCLLMLVVHAAVSVRQCEVWRDDQALWTHTLRFHPDSARALYGLALTSDGVPSSSAEHLLRRAVASAHRYLPAQQGLAMLLLQQGRFVESVAYAEASIAIDDEVSESYLLLGHGLLGLGRLERAIDAYVRASELAPGSANARVSLARALLKARRFDSAIETLRPAASGTESGDLRYMQGVAFEVSGRKQQAVRAYARGGELAPDFAPLAIGEARLLIALERTTEADVVLRTRLTDDQSPAVDRLRDAVRLRHAATGSAP